MKLKQRITLIGLSGALVAGFVYSHIYIHKRNRREIKEIAAELAYSWQAELLLDEVQTAKLEEAIIEFTIKKNEIINSGLSNNSKIERLKRIQNNEHKALQKFLNEGQFENYKLLNRQMTRKA